MYITSGSVVAAARENIQYWLKRHQINGAPDVANDQFATWFANEMKSQWAGIQQIYEGQIGFKFDFFQLVLLGEAVKNAGLSAPEKEAAQKKYEDFLTAFLIKHALWVEIKNAAEGNSGEDQESALIEKLSGNSMLYTDSLNAMWEIQRWFKLYNSYLPKAMEAREALVNEFNMIMGSGSLVDVLAEDAVSEDFNLDEYQIELLRAKAVAAYWEKRVAIAAAVSAYAEELSAGRMTEGEGIRAWEAAKTAYDESVRLYEEEQKKLNDAGLTVKEAEAALGAAVEKVQEADNRLKLLNQQYTSLMAVYAVGNSAYVLDELRGKYRTLLAEYNLLDDFSPTGAFIRYFERGLELGFAQRREETGNLLKNLITGGSDGDKSLAELKTAAEQIKVCAENEDLPKTLDGYGLDKDDPYFILIQQLLSDRDRQIAGAAEFAEEYPDLIGMINSRYGELIRLQMAAAKAAAETDLEIRVQGLRLFTSESGKDWYFGIRKYLPAEEEQKNFDEEGLTRRLAGDVEKSRLDFLKARLELETGALRCFLNGEPDEDGPENTAESLLAFFCAVDSDKAEQGLNILENLLERLEKGTGQFTDNDDENMVIQWFVSGGSFFNGTDGFLTEPLNEYNLAVGLLEVYETYGSRSFFGEKENWERSVRGLRNLFLTYDLEIEDGYLPDIKTIVETLDKKDGDIIFPAAEFLKNFDDQMAALPGVLEDEHAAWQLSFIEYTAAWLFYTGAGMETAGAFILKEREDIQAEYSALQRTYASLVFADERAVEEINRKYRSLKDRETILLYVCRMAAEYEKITRLKAKIEEEGGKHWRQYISEYAANTEQDAAVSSWEQGFLFDALDEAARSGKRINAAFSLYAGELIKTENSECQSAAAAYLLDQKKPWDERIITRVPYLTLDNYYLEAGNIQKLKASGSSIRDEIARLGLGYDFSTKDSDHLKAELEKELEKITGQEDYLHALMLEYSRSVENFSTSGADYDTQYTLLKKSYNLMEESRFLYETQDAIRRWASTAYLGADNNDLEYSKARFERASAVLAALSNLYNNDEERRPYENEEYEAVYREYTESFGRMMLALKIQDTLNSEIIDELQKNSDYYASYQQWLGSFGRAMDYSGTYSPPEKAEWGIRDMISVKDGRLAFSYDNNFVLRGLDENDVKNLSAYFEINNTIGVETNQSSQFEKALRDLSMRMIWYLSDTRKYQQWGLARDYLIYQFIQANGNVTYLNAQYNTADALSRGGSLGELTLQIDMFGTQDKIYSRYGNFPGELKDLQRQAWESLSEAERADLEFYVILTLTGGGSDADSAFSQITIFEHYERIYERVKSWYDTARDHADNWWKGGFLYYGMRDVNRTAYDRVSVSYTEVQSRVSYGQTNLIVSLINIYSFLDAYANSCARLAVMRGTKEENQKAGEGIDLGIGWEEINKSLFAAGRLTEEEILKAGVYWDAMVRDIGGTYQDVPSALAKLTQWTRGKKEDSKRDMEYQWINDGSDRQKKEAVYRATADAFIAGEADIYTLTRDIEAAFGQNAAAGKNHLENIEKTLFYDLEGITADSPNYQNEYAALANEYSSLIFRTYGMRYNAELAVREAEWDQQRKDIEEKYRLWRENAALILERGRADWKAGTLSMGEAYKKWAENFTAEYNRVNTAWAAAYLAGLEDKEKWVERATAAAKEASSEAILALVGADAEMMARSMDTRDPVADTGFFSMEDAGALLDSLLRTAGITNLNEAYTALSGGADTAAVRVRRGIGGAGVWDSGLAQNAAMNLAREANAELAVREAKKLAARAKESAASALRGLAESVDAANKNFRKNMDDMYIMGGQWRRNGKNYIKDIITNSTLFQPVMTSRKTVEGYDDYAMEPVEIKTNLNENYLTGLNSFAIQGLIQNVYEEIETAAGEIFGTGKERELIKKQVLVKTWHTSMAPAETDSGNSEERLIEWFSEEWVTLEDRYQEPGKFGAYIGYRPAVHPNPQIPGKDAMFYDKGSGELGRLMTEYIYFQRLDAQGIGELSKAPWDKAMFYVPGPFTAPSLRTIADIAVQTAAIVVSMAAATVDGGATALGMMALMTAISVSDDAVFNALDVATGYKSWDEAGFEFGKALVISAASNAVGGVFNGVAGVSSGFFAYGSGLTGLVAGETANTLGKTIVQTTMKGLEVAASTTITSALSAVHYDKENGWGYSTNVFYQGMGNLPVNALSAMTSTLTGGIMNTWNSGTGNSKLIGFSELNKKNVGGLNNLIGGLAGQGAAYAAGGDFTLNLLNLNLLSGGKIDGGLLELHLSRDGITMNVGTGGANVSLEAVYGAAQGAVVWGTNSRINNYVRNNDFKNAVTLRAQYGFGDKEQKTQLWNILSGQDEIRIRTGGELTAKTENIDGKRVVYVNGYRDGMSVEDQMYTAAILGHEAYRDGYKIGDINSGGSPVTAADNFNELYRASAAKIMMGDRINQDYEWFYALNADLAFESYLFAETNKTGNGGVFTDYLRETYMNDEDYYWKWANTNGDFQNMDKYRNMPLLNAKSRDQVDALNEQNLEEALEAYKKDLADKEGYTGDLSSFVTADGLTGEDLAEKFSGSLELQKQFGYTEMKFESVYMVGCMFMSAVYGAEAVTGRDFDAGEVNGLLKDNNMYLNESDLSKEMMAEIMTFLSNGNFTVNLVFSGIPNTAQMLAFRDSEDMYLSHIRVKKNGTGAAYHSEMVADLDYSYNKLGRITGIRAVQTANPWNGDGNVNFSAKTALTMDQIARWDVFIAMPTLQYYKNEFYKQRITAFSKNTVYQRGL
jgi:hypothetical protein